jgi:small subunit ribosomal protein S17
MSKLTFRVGDVISTDKNTIKVACKRAYRHPKYGKMRVFVTKFLVHDADCVAKVNDRVRIRHTRPKSSNKYWTLEEIL